MLETERQLGHFIRMVFAVQPAYNPSQINTKDTNWHPA